MKTLSIALFTLIPVLGCAHERHDAHSPVAQVPQAEIDALMASFDGAWNAHSPDAMVSEFAADGTLVTPAGTRADGPEALRELFASPGPTKQTQSVTEVERVQPLAEDLVLVDVTQTLTGPGVEVIGHDRARAVFVVRRTDDGWKVVAARPYVPVGK